MSARTRPAMSGLAEALRAVRGHAVAGHDRGHDLRGRRGVEDDARALVLAVAGIVLALDLMTAVDARVERRHEVLETADQAAVDAGDGRHRPVVVAAVELVGEDVG